MKYLVFLLAVLLWPALSHAELIVCGSTTQYRTHYFADPVVKPPAADCAVIDPQNTALMTSQRTLLDTVPPKHLKVVGGLAVEFTAQEKTDLAAAEELAAQARQVFINELAQQGVCKFETLDEVVTALTNRRANRQALLDTAETNIKAAIQAVSAANLSSLKAILDQMATVQFNVHEGLLEETYLVAENIFKCQIARSKVAR